MNIVAEHTQTVEPSEADRQWWSDQNEDHHDLDADPDDDIEADPWTEGDQWDADGRFDDMANESAWMDAYERGLKTF